MRDGRSEISIATAIGPAVYSDNSGTPATVDRQGYDSLAFALEIGVGGITFSNANRIDFILEHSDDGVAWDPVGPDNVLGATPDNAGVVKSVRTAHAAATVDRIAYVDGTIGDRRYVRLRPAFAGTHGTGTPLSGVAILGEPRFAPAP